MWGGGGEGGGMGASGRSWGRGWSIHSCLSRMDFWSAAGTCPLVAANFVIQKPTVSSLSHICTLLLKHHIPTIKNPTQVLRSRKGRESNLSERNLKEHKSDRFVVMKLDLFLYGMTPLLVF